MLDLSEALFFSAEGRNGGRESFSFFFLPLKHLNFIVCGSYIKQVWPPPAIIF